jgi:hypothetical protein
MQWMQWIAVAIAGPVVASTAYFVALGCSGRQETGPNFTYQVTQASLASDRVAIVAEDRSFVIQPGQLMSTPFHSGCPRMPTTDNYPDAEAQGARRVRVVYPGVTDPLYGILSFCMISDQFHGSASRSYRLEVPQSYVDATEGGRMSVVFEQYGLNNQDYPAWILWLSREPIPQRNPLNVPMINGPPRSQSGDGRRLGGSSRKPEGIKPATVESVTPGCTGTQCSFEP